ncbi:MAG TPA: ROK family protein [Actinocrinis sp.]|uniref:ROK family protein n=1 Tax=Actinocrinis sp. TaxID=1920516 RepID=UPI002DDDBC37|nr:ROK family protein [Actinocrinis sp.]HEV2343802.1 ROK family protein [Actinocrinis sp.]
MTPELSTPVASTTGNDPANNATRLLTALHRRDGAATRAELTAQLDCGRSAVSYALSDLVERGLVVVDEHPQAFAVPGAASGRGRPSHLVTVAPTSPVVIAVHLRVDTLDVGAFELGGRMLRIEREAVEPSPDVEMTMRRIGRLVRMIAEEAQRPCIGVGVSLPSPVRATDGYALAPRHMNWPGVAARDLIAAQFGDATALAGIPVHVGNDANLAALAEYVHGAGRDARNMLFVTTEHVGIGGGLISGGRLFTGASGYAMEVGHTTANPGGELCRCGARGCLEAEADSRALLRAAGRPDAPATGLEYRARVVLADAASGDPAARNAADTVAARVGSGLAVLVNLLDPDRIVLGGLLARVLKLTPESLAAALHEGSFLERAVAVPVVPAQLSAPTLVGAAELALAPLLA